MKGGDRILGDQGKLAAPQGALRLRGHVFQVPAVIGDRSVDHLAALAQDAEGGVDGGALAGAGLPHHAHDLAGLYDHGNVPEDRGIAIVHIDVFQYQQRLTHYFVICQRTELSVLSPP